MTYTSDAAARLSRLERGTTTEEALELFDALPGVELDTMWGLWKGRELRTGHRMEGLLEPYGWYGKEFVDAENVHPLVFADPSGARFSVDPRTMPMGLAPHLPRVGGGFMRRAMVALRPAMGTSEPRARLRAIVHRGAATAAMIYDHLPVIDVFRRVDERTLLGLMDRRGEVRPYFFVLERAPRDQR